MRNKRKEKARNKEQKLIGSYMKRPGAHAFAGGRITWKTVQGKGSQVIPDPTAWTAIRNITKWEQEAAKMKHESAIASVDLGSELKDRLEYLAKSEKSSLSRILKRGLVYYLGFSDDFKGVMLNMAKDLGVQSSFVIERLALAHLGEMAAEEELAGIPKLLSEFTPGPSAKQFYDSWKDNKVKQLKAENESRQYWENLRKYLQFTPEGQAIYERDVAKAKDEYLKKHPDKKDDFLKAEAQQRAWANRSKPEK